MSESLLIAKNNHTQCSILSNKANRHGLITGATGTGKTVTLQSIAEQFSKIGVPVFLTDVKGDLLGLSQTGNVSEKMQQILQQRDITTPQPFAAPTILWDVFGKIGHPVRATIADMGPLLLARILDLNETQTGILNIVFRVAEDEGKLLLDLKDLRAMLQYVADNAAKYRNRFGNINSASVGAIQRNLLQIEDQGANNFFGEPVLDIHDFMRTNQNGLGIVNILAANQLMNAPRLYAVFLLWLLSELFEKLPEIGDPDKPKLVFFFDEAHLLFNDAPKALLERVELVVRLIRSKGVGVYFVTQNPIDIPPSVLAQLGNRVQHALRAFTPRDQRAVKATAQTMRSNPSLNIETVITELAVGEALVSFLDDKGSPNITERAFIIPPGSLIGTIDASMQQQLIQNSPVAGVYDEAVDRESAYEMLQARNSGVLHSIKDLLWGSSGHTGSNKDNLLQSAIKSETKRIGRQLIRDFIRSLIGGSGRGRR